MIQGFKRLFWRNILDPGVLPICLLMPLYLAGLYFAFPDMWLPAMLLLFLSLLWVRLNSLEVGENFVALPALPGRPRTICQRREKKQTCSHQLRSLLRDSHLASAALPDGIYRTLTHEAVLKRMERSGLKILNLRPAYRSTLRSVLLCETGGRCRHCSDRCVVWNQPERQFYLVKFQKIATPPALREENT